MEIGHAIQVVQSYANQYNHGDMLQALEDMHTIYDHLTYEEARAFDAVMVAGHQFCEKVE